MLINCGPVNIQVIKTSEESQITLKYLTWQCLKTKKFGYFWLFTLTCWPDDGARWKVRGSKLYRSMTNVLGRQTDVSIYGCCSWWSCTLGWFLPSGLSSLHQIWENLRPSREADDLRRRRMQACTYWSTMWRLPSAPWTELMFLPTNQRRITRPPLPLHLPHCSTWLLPPEGTITPAERPKLSCDWTIY